MALGFFRGYWDHTPFFFIKYRDNTYTDGWADKTEYSAIYKVFAGYKDGEVYRNDGEYVDTALLIPLNLLTFNNDD